MGLSDEQADREPADGDDAEEDLAAGAAQPGEDCLLAANEHSAPLHPPLRALLSWALRALAEA
jgi:hypothetical protein